MGDSIMRLATFMGWHVGRYGSYWRKDEKRPDEDGRAAPLTWDPFKSLDDAMMLVAKCQERASAYPVVLLEDRYGGSCSGGEWLASVGVGLGAYDDPLGDDITAMEYWGDDNTITDISAGKTPAEALTKAVLAYLEIQRNKEGAPSGQ